MSLYSRMLAILTLALVFGLTGCGGKRKDMAAEDLDQIPEADTAPVDNNPPAAEASSAPQAASDPAPAPAAIPEAPPATETAAADTKSTPEPTPTSDAPKSLESAPNTSGEMGSYSVQKGDTLMKIAFNLYGDIAQWKNLYEWNKDSLVKASQLKAGSQLKYQKPSGEPTIEKNGDPYLIKKGDSLASIANDIYAKPSKWKKIYENNKTLIKDPNKIFAGFYLYYQITEQEKQEAESIKAKRGAAPPLADSGVANPTPDAPPAMSPPSDSQPPAQTAPAQPSAGTTGARVEKVQNRTSGLSALTGRMPASAPKTK